MTSPDRFSGRYACGIAALAFSIAVPLLAQAQGRGGGSPRYDVATEATVTGSVESVEQITDPGGGRGRRGPGGTHITLKTSAETLEVHLGPTAFLNEKKVTVAKGDTLVVVGSRVAVDGERVFIAKEVKKSDSVWTLRDAAGLPLWRGRGGSAAGHMMNGMGWGMMTGGHYAGTMGEMGDIRELFINHDRITRTVANLPDGIRTVTESSDPHIARILKDHVTSMGRLVETGNDPGLPIESQALRSIYQNYDKIQTTFEPTPTGIVVIQTSTDGATVAALQQHASEVTDFVEEGMAAMHRAMMKNCGGMMHRGMMGTMPKDQTTPTPR